MKILVKILSLVIIGMAIYLLDLKSWDSIFFSVIMMLCGVSFLLQDSKSESVRAFSKTLSKIGFILALIFLILRFINH